MSTLIPPISNMIPTQIYRNVPFTEIKPTVSTPKYTIATMYNYYDNELLTSSTPVIESAVNTMVLNDYDPSKSQSTRNQFNVDMSNNATANYLNEDTGNFKMVTFLNLFFATGVYFNVSQSNYNNAVISFNSQTFSSGNSIANKFDLYNFLLDCYLENTGITRSSINPRILIHLKKETNKFKSLADIKGTTIATSWDALISDLTDGGVVDASGCWTRPSTAPIPLQIIVYYHSFVLDMDVKIVFTYVVDIAGYALSTNLLAQPTYNNGSNSNC